MSFFSALNDGNIGQYLSNINWMSNSAVQWQAFYQNASRTYFYGGSGNLRVGLLQKIPTYADLPQMNCTSRGRPNNSTNSPPQCGLASHPGISPALLFLLSCIFLQTSFTWFSFQNKEGRNQRSAGQDETEKSLSCRSLQGTSPLYVLIKAVADQEIFCAILPRKQITMLIVIAQPWNNILQQNTKRLYIDVLPHSLF